MPTILMILSKKLIQETGIRVPSFALLKEYIDQLVKQYAKYIIDRSIHLKRIMRTTIAHCTNFKMDLATVRMENVSNDFFYY